MAATRRRVPASSGRRPRAAPRRVIRVNTPSTTMSLTVSRQAASTPRSARDGEERRGLHLDREHAARRPALVLALVRVVEEVARDDRADVQRLVAVLRDVHGLVDERPRRGRAVRLVVDEVHRGRVGRHGAQRDDQVAERVARPAARRRCRRGSASCSRAGSAPRRRSSRPGSPSRCPAPRPACPSRCRCSRAGRARSFRCTTSSK